MCALCVALHGNASSSAISRGRAAQGAGVKPKHSYVFSHGGAFFAFCCRALCCSPHKRNGCLTIAPTTLIATPLKNLTPGTAALRLLGREGLRAHCRRDSAPPLPSPIAATAFEPGAQSPPPTPPTDPCSQKSSHCCSTTAPPLLWGGEGVPQGSPLRPQGPSAQRGRRRLGWRE